MSKSVLNFLSLAILFIFLDTPLKADEPDDNEYINVETNGKFTNVTVDGPELRKQNEFLKRLQGTPINDVSARQDLLARYNELSPPFLYELARRTFPISKEEAVKWYFMGTIRARLDAVLCTDRTSAQGISFLPQMAFEVGNFIQENSGISGKIGVDLLEGDDLMKGTASPWWICSHGMQAIGKAVQGENPKELTWLKPQAEWEDLFNSILDGARQYFETLQAPMGDPVPIYEVTLEPEFITGEGPYKYFGWVNKNQLVFMNEVNRMGINPLYIWQEGGGLKLVTESVRANIFCVGGGNIFFETGWEVVVPGMNGTFKSTYEIGSLEQLRKEENTYTGIPVRPAYPGWAASRYNSTWRQNPFDCEMETSDKLNARFGEARNWVRLPNEKGFLATGDSSQELGPGLYYLATEASNPIKISDTNQDLGCLKFHAFLNSVSLANTCPTYFVSSSGKVPDRDRLFNILLSLEPEIPTLKKVPFDLLPGEKGSTQTLFTKRGVIRLMKEFYTPVDKREGGFYWYSEKSGPVKIWQGYPDYAEVSPDGCKIGFTIVTRPKDVLGGQRKIAILDVCEALPE